jgi:hypothetical protein
MKKLVALLFSLVFVSNSFGMEPEEALSNQNIKFDKIEKRQLQEKNNLLLQENNKLLHQIKHQNKVIILQNYLSYEYMTRLVDQHRTLSNTKSEVKAKNDYALLIKKTYLDQVELDKSWENSNKKTKDSQ